MVQLWLRSNRLDAQNMLMGCIERSKLLDAFGGKPGVDGVTEACELCGAWDVDDVEGVQGWIMVSRRVS